MNSQSQVKVTAKLIHQCLVAQRYASPDSDKVQSRKLRLYARLTFKAFLKAQAKCKTPEDHRALMQSVNKLTNPRGRAFLKASMM